jgi:predicted aspartyl protease
VSSIFRIRIVACNPKNEGQATQPLEALVDTSSDLTWLPGEVLWTIGVTPRRKRYFPTPDKGPVVRGVGYVILRANGRETAEDVVFGEWGDSMLIGVRTLESFGIATDEVTHRFVSLTAMAAFYQQPPPKWEPNIRV